jgi:two-component system, NtrC family, response regulator AtoC
MTEQREKSNDNYHVVLFGPALKETVSSVFEIAGIEHLLLCAENDNQFRELVKTHSPQLILLNFDAKEIRLFDLVDWLKKQTPGATVIGITKKGSLNKAMRAVRAGLFSVADINSDMLQLEKDIAAVHSQWQQDIDGQQFLDTRKSAYDFSKIIGESKEMQSIFQLVSRVVRRKWATVLIRGETGTGKELIARSIHYNTCQSNEPFVEINCSALTESLLESELFGHEKGAFTDAKTSKIGLFELAQNGTLFLDEIGDISPKVQIKLLKALEEKTIRRVGGTRDIKINTRIITATNRDLQAAIKKGEFRNDLYYRLNVLTINVPPLRNRGEDVLLIATHFLDEFAAEYECPLEGFEPLAKELLKRYQWPGNVRELRHAIERITLLSDNVNISVEELEQTLESETPIILSEYEEAKQFNIEIPPHGITLEEAEKAVISEILDRYGWNKRRACRTLKISRPRLDRKIQLYGLSPQK